MIRIKKHEAVTDYVTELSKAHVYINTEDSNRSTYNNFKSVHAYREHLTRLELAADDEVLQHIHDKAFVEHVNNSVSMLCDQLQHPNLLITNQHIKSMQPLELSVYDSQFIASFENVRREFINRFIKSNNIVTPLKVEVSFTKRDIIELAVALLHHPAFSIHNDGNKSESDSDSIAYICSRLCYIFNMPPIFNVKVPASQIKRRKKSKSPFLDSLLDAFNSSL